jgi:hypothetical protein
MSDDDETGDTPPAPQPFADNVVPFRRDRKFRARSSSLSESRDDDELLARANGMVTKWRVEKAPSMTEVQNFFHELICDGGSAMLKDKVVAAIIIAFGDAFGGKRALAKTWNDIAKQVSAERMKAARERDIDDDEKPLTADEKAVLRGELWPSVRELAEAPDLMERIIQQVQTMGVVNETELITLVFISATSRVLKQPINPLVKGPSSAGKSFTSTRTLELIPPEFVSYLTSSSALSLVYDERSLSHTVLVVYEANQLQADENSIFSMLLRTLISEGKIVHQTTVEDPDSPTGRRVVRIEREGPISLVITTTGELHAENETRMLSYNVTESQQQTRSVINSIAARAAGASEDTPDMKVFHNLQRWITLGPNDAVIPFAKQIAEKIPPSMVRFRRDVGSLFTFIKASAILHQAQRQIDDKGRVVATVADYRLAYPIFSKVMAQTSGQGVTETVRAVVDLIAARTNAPAAKPAAGRFARSGASNATEEVVISSEQIGALTGTGKVAAHRAVRAAIDLGFLANNETRRGKPYRLVLKHGVDDAAVALLPHPDTIEEGQGDV